MNFASIFRILGLGFFFSVLVSFFCFVFWG
jgi:hypothetical protein